MDPAASIRLKPKVPSCTGGYEVTQEVAEGQIRQEVPMRHEDQKQEKRNMWLYITNITLITLLHVSVTLGHTWDSLAAKHGRPLLASA